MTFVIMRASALRTVYERGKDEWVYSIELMELHCMERATGRAKTGKIAEMATTGISVMTNNSISLHALRTEGDIYVWDSNYI